jgi:hypothetical protein
MDQLNPETRRKAEPIRHHDAAPTLTAEESRQGIMTGRIRWVLAISVMLAVVALVALYGVFFA